MYESLEIQIRDLREEFCIDQNYEFGHLKVRRCWGTIF
jgi:hypothetical protein